MSKSHKHNSPPLKEAALDASLIAQKRENSLDNIVPINLRNFHRGIVFLVRAIIQLFDKHRSFAIVINDYNAIHYFRVEKLEQNEQNLQQVDLSVETLRAKIRGIDNPEHLRILQIAINEKKAEFKNRGIKMQSAAKSWGASRGRVYERTAQNSQKVYVNEAKILSLSEEELSSIQISAGAKAIISKIRQKRTKNR